jgi:hypothetical protein
LSLRVCVFPNNFEPVSRFLLNSWGRSYSWW